jgi:hypothetical protein
MDMTADILVKFKGFPELEIVLQKTKAGIKYKELVNKCATGTEKLIFRDRCLYTIEYLKSMLPQAKELLGWNWSADNYLDWEVTHRLHKDLEILDQSGNWGNTPEEHQNLIIEMHKCIHAIENRINKTSPIQNNRGAQLQVEWYVDDSFPLPEDFEFKHSYEFGDVTLQYPHVGAAPWQVYKENNWTNVAQTCKFVDRIKPGIPIMINSHQLNFNQDDYISWFRQHGADFLKEHGEEKLLQYTGFPIIGKVVNLEVLLQIKKADLLECEYVKCSL